MLVDEDDFCELDEDMLRTLQDIEAITAQYNADIAHFDSWLILFGDNGSRTGKDKASDSTDMSEEIWGKLVLIDTASACVMGK